MKPPHFLTILTLLAGTARAVPDETVDFGKLLESMLDRTGIAEFPSPEFVCKQASSYNRRSKTPGNPDWFAGCDFDQFYGSIEMAGRKEWIMLDADGPGVVTRWWPMPFRESAEICVTHHGTGPSVEVELADIGIADWRWTDRTMYFHTTNVRGRIHDRIPFNTDLKFDMELYHWQPNTRNDYATTTHWYAFGDATDNGQLTPAWVCEKVGQAFP